MKEAMKLAFRVLERVSAVNDDWDILPPSLSYDVEEAINVLKEALAKQEQGEPDYKTLAIQLQQDRKQEQDEPIGTAGELFTNAALERLDFRPSTKIYTTPQQRTWVGLTDVERSQLVILHHGWNEYGKAIEAKLKELNT